jgi:alginate O-acetyltransferase complex protein AlgI
VLFNSSEYMAVFLPVVLLGCLLLRRFGGPKAAQAWILTASIFFYTWWNPAHLPYLLGSILVNWGLARVLASAQQPKRKHLLQLGLVLNISYLCVFKYVNFFLSNLAFMLPRGFHLPDLAFPLGISFFTLIQIMYLVDIYEGLIPAMKLFDFSTFVSFFPYVTSGPIARAKRIQHQFADFGGKENATVELIARGLFIFAVGLFKKVLFADVFAKVADGGFGTAAHLSMIEAWCFSIAFTLQIYFDFSGYSDMAIGSALMLGIEIPRNFDAPLRSKSIIEFWQRWHISLSQFITTYLYTPMLKSMWRISLLTSAIATFIAMTIAGLWHGPAWTFVVYGAIHGLALACNQYWRKKKMPIISAFPSWLLTFIFFNVAFLIFRAPDLKFASHMTAALFDPRHGSTAATLVPVVRTLTRIDVLLLITGITLAFFGKSSDELSRGFKPTLFNALAVSAMLVACWWFMALNSTQNFLYYKF